MTKLLRHLESTQGLHKAFRSDKTAEWYGILEAFPFYLMNKFDGHVLFVVNQKLERVRVFLCSCLLQNFRTLLPSRRQEQIVLSLSTPYDI